MRDRVLRPELRKNALAGLLSGLGRLVDIVYPPVCPGCGVTLGSHRGLCARCWAGIRFIERPYCEVLGLPFSRDLGPGILSAEAIAEPPAFDRLRSVAVHAGVARRLVHGLKYRDRTDLATMMAAWMLRAGDGTVEAADAILPVPLHRFRMMSHKFNQSAELGRAVSKLSGLPFSPSAVRRVKLTRQQVGLERHEREENVRAAFRVPPDAEIEISGRRVLVIDDVYTTGATVRAVAKALKRSGAGAVDILTFARVLPGDFRPDESATI